MTSLDDAENVVRVERGVADESELAAVVLVLLSRLAARRRPAVDEPYAADGKRACWEPPDVYRAARSWY